MIENKKPEQTKFPQELEAFFVLCETWQARAVGALLLVLFNLFATTKLAAFLLGAIWFLLVWGLKVVNTRPWKFFTYAVILAIVLTISWPIIKKEISDNAQDSSQSAPLISQANSEVKGVSISKSSLTDGKKYEIRSKLNKCLGEISVYINYAGISDNYDAFTDYFQRAMKTVNGCSAWIEKEISFAAREVFVNRKAMKRVEGQGVRIQYKQLFADLVVYSDGLKELIKNDSWKYYYLNNSEAKRSVTSDDLKNGVVRYQSVAAIFQHINQMPIVSQKKYVENNFIGKRVKNLPVKIYMITERKEDYQVISVDSGQGYEYWIYSDLGKDWQQLVSQLKKGDDIFISGTIITLESNPGVMALENTNVSIKERG